MNDELIMSIALVGMFVMGILITLFVIGG